MLGSVRARLVNWIIAFNLCGNSIDAEPGLNTRGHGLAGKTTRCARRHTVGTVDSDVTAIDSFSWVSNYSIPPFPHCYMPGVDHGRPCLRSVSLHSSLPRPRPLTPFLRHLFIPSGSQLYTNSPRFLMGRHTMPAAYYLPHSCCTPAFSYTLQCHPHPRHCCAPHVTHHIGGLADAVLLNHYSRQDEEGQGRRHNRAETRVAGDFCSGLCNSSH